MAAVDVESLTVRYGAVTAVDDLTFRAEAGRVTCVLGPNGAGKTSTIEALEGVRRPAAGRLSVVGLDPVADHTALTARIGVMLQEGGIHPAVRVGEALRHAAALYPESLDPGDLIDQLGLTGLESRPYRRLSGGEQRRVALALALVGRPQVAFLDEPTAGVDPAGRQVIRQVVADLRNDGVTVLLTTHDLDEAERVADHVVIVVEGRLVAEGSVEALTRTLEGEQHVRFRAPAGLDRRSLATHLGGVEVAEEGPGEYAVAAAPTPATVAAITAWLADHDLPLADLRAGRQRLEDVYLRLTATPRPARPGRATVLGTEAPTTPPPDTAPTTTPPATTPTTPPPDTAPTATPPVATPTTPPPDTGPAAAQTTPAPGSTSADAPAATPPAATPPAATPPAAASPPAATPSIPAEAAPGPAPAAGAEEDDGLGEPHAAERSPRDEPSAEAPGDEPGPGPSLPDDTGETDPRGAPPGAADHDDGRGGS